jgi:hypothetical protein
MNVPRLLVAPLLAAPLLLAPAPLVHAGGVPQDFKPARTTPCACATTRR